MFFQILFVRRQRLSNCNPVQTKYALSLNYFLFDILSLDYDPNATYINDLFDKVWNTTFCKYLALTCLMIEKNIKRRIFVPISSRIECTI